MLNFHPVAILLAFAIASTCQAGPKTIKIFNSGSYQQILAENAEKPFMLAIWSIDCPSCLKDMDVLYTIHQKHPDIKLIMLSTDEPNASAEVDDTLTKHKLKDLENWMFGSDDAQKMRYEIDPRWYGELPRTYFFTSSHARVGVSGALQLKELESQLTKMTR